MGRQHAAYRARLRSTFDLRVGSRGSDWQRETGKGGEPKKNREGSGAMSELGNIGKGTEENELVSNK